VRGVGGDYKYTSNSQLRLLFKSISQILLLACIFTLQLVSTRSQNPSIIMQFISTLALFATVALAQISSEPSGSNCDGRILYLFLLSLSRIELTTSLGTSYSQSNINDAATAALNYYAQGQTVGDDSYPHQYNDYEGFSFSCSAPYLEFPIQTSGTYSGGSPGADRVVIGSISSDDSSAQYCAVITHDGQSGNNFGECTDS
jgi:NADH:ubiquinone oxidoreductase subunit K